MQREYNKTLNALAIVLIWIGLNISAHAEDITTLKPTRIVSLNVCVDQILMEIADKSNIAALSPFARNPYYSQRNKEALSYPIHNNSVEDIISFKPDIIFAGGFSDPALVSFLRANNLRIIQIAPAHSWEEIEKNIHLIAKYIHETPEADRYLNTSSQKLDILRHSAKAQSNRQNDMRAAVFQANGMVSGVKTLENTILDIAGYKNIAHDLQKKYPNRLSFGATFPIQMEELIIEKPDFLILSQTQSNTFSRANEATSHPILNHLVQQGMQIKTQTISWVCDTPDITNAVAELLK